MRLLNTSTIQLKDFIGDIPPFAILSHTWGEGEVSFEEAASLPDTKASGAAFSLGGQKIISFCDLALSDGWDWAWVDTCCIDKTSSSELSEAINSMFRWYAEASICYV